MKKVYYVVKLAPQVSSWCDMENNIYLSKPNKVSRCLKEGCDMKMIRKGVKAGLLLLEEHYEECEQKQEVKQEIPEPVQAPAPEEVAETAAEVAIKKARKRRKEEVKVEVNVIEKDKEDKE